MRNSMRNLVMLVLLGLLSPAPTGAAFGDHLWSQGYDAGGFADTGGSSHVATAGNFFATVDFGGGVFIPVNFLGGDVFLARFDVDGNHVWSRHITPGGFGFAVDAVTAAPDGSIYLAGRLMNGDIDFGGGLLSGISDLVLAAFESDGTHRWSFVVGAGTVTDLVASNAVVACTGYTSGSLDFGGGALATAGGTDVFLGALDANGGHRFSQVFGDAGDQGGMGLALTSSDGIVLAASALSSVDFGGGVLTPTGSSLCLAAYNSVGAHQWSWIRDGDFSPGAGILLQLGLAVSSAGEIALGGQFRGSTDLGGGTLNSVAFDDAFVARYDANGNHLSSQALGGDSSEGVQGVSWDSEGNLACAGTFLSSSIDLGGGSMAHSGTFGSDSFLAVFDNGGSHSYSTTFAGNNQYLISPRFQSSGELLLFGGASGSVDFGGGPVATTQFFLAQFEGASIPVGNPPTRANSILSQNIPNPFNPQTSIRFRLDNDAETRLEIFDVAGRRVRTLAAGLLPAGDHNILYDGRDSQGRPLASGVYRYRLQSGGSTLVKSMILLK